MIVIDASAALDLLLRKRNAPTLETRIFGGGEDVHAPHLIDLEVLQVLRRHIRTGQFAARHAEAALETWLVLPVARHRHDLLLPSVWRLSTSVSAYDGVYIALAEALGATLVTSDARLGRAHGHTAQIEVFAA